MKKRILLLFLTLLTAFALCACGEDPIEPSYTSSSVTMQSFTEIAGENPDSLDAEDNDNLYTYKIKDGDVGATAFNLYKDYLDKNFTYSAIDSSVDDDAYSLVYYTENGDKIVYTESVKGSGAYTITVSVPK